MNEIKFEPQLWNDYLNASCYSFALNYFTNEIYHVGDIYPGKRFDISCSLSQLIETFIKEANHLGYIVEETDLSDNDFDDKYKIFLVRNPEIRYYHFYRRGIDGIWSHKKPYELPNRIGYNGEIITNPFESAEPGYIEGRCFSLTKKLK